MIYSPSQIKPSITCLLLELRCCCWSIVSSGPEIKFQNVTEQQQHSASKTIPNETPRSDKHREMRREEIFSSAHRCGGISFRLVWEAECRCYSTTIQNVIFDLRHNVART